jgi:hypothetical protein
VQVEGRAFGADARYPVEVAQRGGQEVAWKPRNVSQKWTLPSFVLGRLTTPQDEHDEERRRSPGSPRAS